MIPPNRGGFETTVATCRKKKEMQSQEKYQFKPSAPTGTWSLDSARMQL